MTIPLGTYGVEIAIVAMAAATYAIRISGFWLMGRVPLTPRVRRMLEALPGAVIVATVLPIVVREGVTATLALLVAIAVMALRRNDILAVACGVAFVALARALVP